MLLRVGKTGLPVIVVVGEVYCWLVSGNGTRGDPLGMQEGQLLTIFNQEETFTPETIPTKRARSINDPTRVIVVYVDVEAKGKTLVLFVV
jgi:hypothetical protein